MSMVGVVKGFSWLTVAMQTIRLVKQLKVFNFSCNGISQSKIVKYADQENSTSQTPVT